MYESFFRKAIWKRHKWLIFLKKPSNPDFSGSKATVVHIYVDCTYNVYLVKNNKYKYENNFETSILPCEMNIYSKSNCLKEGQNSLKKITGHSNYDRLKANSFPSTASSSTQAGSLDWGPGRLRSKSYHLPSQGSRWAVPPNRGAWPLAHLTRMP